jgi:hypothetical protein
MSQPAYGEPYRDWRGSEPAYLTRDELDVVQEMLAEIAPKWSADLNHASLDESTIVVTPAGANDMIGPAFVLHCTRGRFHLDQFRWDEYRKLGGFRTFDEALALLRTRLMPLMPQHALPADQAGR